MSMSPHQTGVPMQPTSNRCTYAAHIKQVYLCRIIQTNTLPPCSYKDYDYSGPSGFSELDRKLCWTNLITKYILFFFVCSSLSNSYIISTWSMSNKRLNPTWETWTQYLDNHPRVPATTGRWNCRWLSSRTPPWRSRIQAGKYKQPGPWMLYRNISQPRCATVARDHSRQLWENNNNCLRNFNEWMNSINTSFANAIYVAIAAYCWFESLWVSIRIFGRFVRCVR